MDKICGVEGCGKKTIAKNLCSKHYQWLKPKDIKLRKGCCYNCFFAETFFGKEIWKDIYGYEKFYQISNFGRVKTFRRVKPQILSLRNDKRTGYVDILLTDKNGKQSRHWIHRLVCFEFKTNPNNKPMVNHKKSIRNHNYFENLEWVTPKENMEHAFREGFGSTKEANEAFSKKCKVIHNGKKYIFKSISEFSRHFNISNGKASYILYGKNKNKSEYEASFL